MVAGDGHNQGQTRSYIPPVGRALKTFYYYYFEIMGMLYICGWVHSHKYWFLQRPKKDVGSPRAGAKGGC